MADYYYSDGERTLGPYSFDELKNRNLSADTPVWHDSLRDWLPFADVNEIRPHLTYKKIPPSLPHKGFHYPQKLESGPVPKSRKRMMHLGGSPIIFSRKMIHYSIAWFSFHVLALITSYLQIPIFNTVSDPKTQLFWPFVNFIDEYFVQVSEETRQFSETKLKFNGLFVNYDWTEFSTYAGGVLLFMFFYYLYRKAG